MTLVSSANERLFELKREAMKERFSRNYCLGHSFLFNLWRRSLRIGSWTRLSLTRKALYRCALWIAKVRGCISNTKLVEQVLQITWQLLHDFQSSIAIAGKMRALTALERFGKPGGVFSWAPQVRQWLHDAEYILYLGVSSQP